LSVGACSPLLSETVITKRPTTLNYTTHTSNAYLSAAHRTCPNRILRDCGSPPPVHDKNRCWLKLQSPQYEERWYSSSTRRRKDAIPLLMAITSHNGP
jgi:hypothetical protein